MQEVGESGDVEGVEKIDLEEEPIADMVAVEGYSFYHSDMCDECGLSIVSVAMITDC